jgi:hypothetical protein
MGKNVVSKCLAKINLANKKYVDPEYFGARGLISRVFWRRRP